MFVLFCGGETHFSAFCFKRNTGYTLNCRTRSSYNERRIVKSFLFSVLFNNSAIVLRANNSDRHGGGGWHRMTRGTRGWLAIVTLYNRYVDCTSKSVIISDFSVSLLKALTFFLFGQRVLTTLLPFELCKLMMAMFIDLLIEFKVRCSVVNM